MIKQRSVVMCIILTFITFGIYGIYWFVCLSDDANTVSDSYFGTSGLMALLLVFVTFGIYSWYWAYKQGEKIDEARRNRGLPPGSHAVVYLLLHVFQLSLVAWALMQNDLNHLAE